MSNSFAKYKFIEQALGGSVLIDIDAIPSGSAWTADTPAEYNGTLDWLTDNDAVAGDGSGNSAGRARYVEFVTSLTTPVKPTLVKIRGDTVDILPNRVFIVRNNLNTASDLSDLVLDVGDGSDYTVRPGAFALVVSNGSSTLEIGDGVAEPVFNALSDLQIENLIFGNDADITIRDGSATSLEIKSTLANSEFLRFDTLNNPWGCILLIRREIGKR